MYFRIQHTTLEQIQPGLLKPREQLASETELAQRLFGATNHQVCLYLLTTEGTRSRCLIRPTAMEAVGDRKD
jgi:hypothetical protein